VVTDIKHYFPDGVMALDSVSFEANKGQMVQSWAKRVW